jgi:hypothetical protein
MKTQSCPIRLHRQQRGAASLAIALLILFIMATAVATLATLSVSSAVDSSRQEDEVAARLLAESAMERAQSALSSAASGGAFSSSTCTSMGTATYTLGSRGGSMSYVSATAGPTSCTTACSTCTVIAKGTVGSSTRLARAQLATSSVVSQGVAGFGSSFTLNLAPTVNNTLVYTNISYRANDSGGGGIATLDNCTSGLTSCSSAWDIQGQGANAVSGRGAYASVATAGSYSITGTLTKSSVAATRYFVATGAFFTPLVSGGTVSYTGSYGATSNTSSTNGASTGSLPSTWMCGVNSGTGSVSNVGSSDTLVYGFASLTATSELGSVSIGSSSSPLGHMSQVLRMDGSPDSSLGDKYLYSQIWSLYNAGYYPGSTPNAVSGVSYTATVGAIGTGTTTGSGTSRTLTTASLTGTLNVGDVFTINSVTGWSVTAVNSATSYAVKPPGGGTSNIVAPAKAFTVTATKTLNVTSMANAGMLQLSDEPSGTSLAAGNAITSVPAGTQTGAYGLQTAVATITSGSPVTGMGIVNASLGTRRITLSGAPSSTPSVGTAIALSDGTSDLFGRATFTASITGTSMTVSGLTGTISAGDAVFGPNITPGTVVATVSGSTYTVSPSQTAASGSAVARAAVKTVYLSTAYEVSSAPTSSFSGRKICGGLCPFLVPYSSTTVAFNVGSVGSGDDWTSGFVCLSGVNPTNIQVLGSITNTSSRTLSTEPVY